VHVCSV